ncbi:TPA: hypothetical protein HA241_03985 [Candidatus Woesearchaeota archaeon]|nr:hypothetical protein [Candidatus Woesearchaeota archaeon]
MTTTVQIQDDTLELLKKVKEETKSASYDEAIKKIVLMRVAEKSLGGYLSGCSSKDNYKGVRDKRDRF